MDLVNELQISAEQDDVLTVLRRTRRLASKLGRQDIDEWLRFELDGYKRRETVPEYRLIRSTLAMKSNGYVPAGYGYIMDGISDLPHLRINPTVPLGDPISDVLSLIDGVDKGRGVYRTLDRGMELDKYARSRIDSEFRDQVEFLLHLNETQVKAIPEQIKNKVLEWACALEAAGVTGAGMSFSPKEKEIAHSVIFNIYGSHIEQLNNMGTNQRGDK